MIIIRYFSRIPERILLYSKITKHELRPNFLLSTGGCTVLSGILFYTSYGAFQILHYGILASIWAGLGMNLYALNQMKDKIAQEIWLENESKMI